MIHVGTGPALAALRARIRTIDALAADLGHRYRVEVRLPSEVAERLGFFDGGSARQPQRPLFASSRHLHDQATAAMRSASAPVPHLNVLTTLTAGAVAAQEVWVERLETNGGDLGPWDSLSPEYATRKARRGLDPRTGISTGESLRALRGALVIVSKA